MKYHNSIQLTDHIFCYTWHGSGNNCNTCILKDVRGIDKPHIIVDPGHITNEYEENCFTSLEETMAADGIKIEDIGLIINTHSHSDHCEANEQIVTRSGAKVTLSKEEDEYRATLGKQLCEMFGTEVPNFKVDYYLREGDTDIEVNSSKIKILLTPGHSPGSICLYIPKDKVLITGDVIFLMSVGRTDFPGGDTALLKNSIDRLTHLDVECLLPGHNTDSRGIIQGKEKVLSNFAAVQEFFF
jgi:hydroxyacylglutathione hydrolase